METLDRLSINQQLQAVNDYLIANGLLTSLLTYSIDRDGLVSAHVQFPNNAIAYINVENL